MFIHEYWWIFPIICMLMMGIMLVLFYRRGGGFCGPMSNWFFNDERIKRLEEEIQELKQNKGKG